MSVIVKDAPLKADIPSSCVDFLGSLDGPTIFRVAGADPSRVRVVSGTLHGSEPSGISAIHRVLKDGVRPTTDVLFFIGAVDAAKAHPVLTTRYLPGRRDLNRCFRPPFDDADGRIAETALAILKERPPELALDLHNNSGRNPSYAIVMELEGRAIALGTMFSDRVIRMRLALGTFTEAFHGLCPTVTIECGQSHDPHADATAHRGLLRLLALDTLDPVVVTAKSTEVFVDPIRVELVRGLSVVFAHDEKSHEDVDVIIDPEIDRHNFTTVGDGVDVGSVRSNVTWPIRALAEDGTDVSTTIFERVKGNGRDRLRTKASMVPVMMTTDPHIARNDCLFYAIHRRQ